MTRVPVVGAALLAAAGALWAPCVVKGAESESYSRLSLEELLNLPIVSASRSAEKLSEAPATVIVITHEEMVQRGYSEMTDMLDDLPGMDVVRTYGDTWFKDYWRGLRRPIGSTYLVMVDGVVFNDLYRNEGEALAALPLSSVDHVEIVYGPASVVYGPNAFVGVINVITRKAPAEDGSHVSATLSGGSNSTRIVDVDYSYKKGDLNFRLTGRVDNGLLDADAANNYEYTKDKYYADRSLWGGFVDNSNIAGSYHSPHSHRGLDMRANFGDTELAFQYYVLDSGYGNVYPGDKVQNNAVWRTPDLSLYFRQQHDLGALHSTTLVRYHQTGVSNDSFFLEGYGTPHIVDYSYWKDENQSWSLYQDFEYKASEHISLVGGLKYEQKDLQKAYEVNYGPSLPPVDISGSSYPYPDPPFDTNLANNRITTEDTGAYLLGRFSYGNNTFHLGVRSDHNSEYGTANTLRAGYVGKFDRWIVKLLYGQSFQEPAPRVLYGGWQGSGSDPNLEPEDADTLEASVTYNLTNFSGLLSVYDLKSDKTIVTFAGGATNLGKSHVKGADLHAQWWIHVPGVQRFTLLGYYSYIKGDEDLPVTGGGYINQPIGDLARNKAHLIATADFSSHFSASLRARYIGSRDTVLTNPVGHIDSYTVADINLLLRDFWVPGLGLSFKVTNLFDKVYFEPGVREADAGSSPGYWDASGNWVGSDGWYNSLLPQPGRAFLLSLQLSY